MALQQKSKYCRRCKSKTLHVKSQPKKVGCGAHVLLTLVTCGLWVPIAVLLMGLGIWADLFAPYHCQACGKRN